ncbi:hypothetical protein SAMN05421773_108138 [Streptomyces aidingensis]|uniref:Uncharacterized protein n=1 Tax=Streptomyces aidingensis TaxID=910347 RepID=A0A1I1NRF8_9ACTN|nr:hypothetical protein SAMN05421773_108138 [Streptomyces aidingensis]
MPRDGAAELRAAGRRSPETGAEGDGGGTGSVAEISSRAGRGRTPGGPPGPDAHRLAQREGTALRLL